MHDRPCGPTYRDRQCRRRLTRALRVIKVRMDPVDGGAGQNSACVQVAGILDDIAARSLDDVLTEFRAADEHADLLQRWPATETWS